MDTPWWKQVTKSSSFPSTITTPNFKPISQTIGEFWKRYHQKKKSEKGVQKLKLRDGLEYSSHQLVFFCAIILKLPQLLLLLFSWRIFYPDFFDLLNFGSLKKKIIIIKITKIWAFDRKLLNFERAARQDCGRWLSLDPKTKPKLKVQVRQVTVIINSQLKNHVL